MNRKKFIVNSAMLCGGALILPAFSSCSNLTDPSLVTRKPDISFSNNYSLAVLTAQISSSSSIIEASARSAKEIVIATASTVITVKPEGRKLRLTQSNGESAFLRFGTVKTSPSVILEHIDGRIIQESSIVPSGIGNWSPEEWLGKAVLVLAGALTVWIGATVVKVVAAAIAFVAMNVLILSTIVAAAAIMVWLFERTGWSFEGLIELLRSGTLWIEELLRSIFNP